ncbi:MAG: hypothetical protein AB7J35_11055 [Dehalococcoidia bacterium]
MPPFLHAAHQLRQTDGLAMVSWLLIGLAVGAVIISWGQIVAWLRRPDSPAPLLRAWGRDEHGYYFEIANAQGHEWLVELAGGESMDLTPDADGPLFRAGIDGADPVAVRSSSGVRLLL